MRWCRIIVTSEAAPWLAVLLLTLVETPGKASSPRTYDKDALQSRRTWCEEKNACAGREERKPPRCLDPGEALLGADLCACRFSCVAIRGLGESCGSQLSIWPEVLDSDPTPSSVTILATTWCREELVCVNFKCVELNANVHPATVSKWSRIDRGLVESERDHRASDIFGQDVISIGGETTSSFSTAKLHQKSTTPSWEPMAVNQGDANLGKTDSSSTSISRTSSVMKSGKKLEPCYAKSDEEMMTISSYPSDDLLGQIATTTLNDRVLEIVYDGDLISELKVLLNVVDFFHEDSMLDEKMSDSLARSFWSSGSSADDDDEDGDEASLGYEDYVEAETPSSLNLTNFVFGVPRQKREVERTEEDVVGFDAPGNIQEILIRGASAHKEYVDGFRGQEQNPKTLNKSGSTKPAEASSQEDESTVRVHITNRPRKVQTLIDLEEEDEGEEIDDEERRSLQLANRGYAKDGGRLSPLADVQNTASHRVTEPLGHTTTTEQNAVMKKTAESRPPDVSQPVNSPWNEPAMAFNDRLTLVEMRISLFEKVLEEIVKWCNLGVFSMSRDCLMPQNSDIRYGRWGPESDEHLAVASGIDAVRIEENGRKPSAKMPRRDGLHDTRIPETAELGGTVRARQMAHRGRYEPINRNFFRTIPDNGSPRRPPITGQRGLGRPGKSRCRNPSNRRSQWRQPIAEAIGDPPAHRTAQRSVPSSMNPFFKNSSRLGRPTSLGQTPPRDHPDSMSFGTLQETQIPEPVISGKMITTLRGREKRESLPQEKMTSSSGIRSWKISELDLQRSIGRSKRSAKLVHGIIPPDETLRKIHAGSSGPSSRAEKLFERETAAGKGLEPDMNRNAWEGMIIAGDADPGGIAGPLIVSGNSKFRNLPKPMANRLLFRNPDLPQTRVSIPYTEVPLISEDDHKPLDSSTASYTVASHENSTIRIEEISENDGDDSLPQIGGSSASEDDFDHIYEGVEAEDEEVDFEYDVAYDQVEYVDGSSVEIATEMSADGLRELEVGLNSELELSRDRIHSVLFPHERNRRTPKKGDQCESGGPTKREMPLLLFGSTGKHEPKTIIWPSKWIGYRKDSLQRARGSSDQENTMDGESSAKETLVDTTTQILPTRRTTESLIMGRRGNDGETSNDGTPKMSGLIDRRVRKNRRKLVWR